MLKRSKTSRMDGWMVTASRHEDQTPNRSFLFQPEQKLTTGGSSRVKIAVQGLRGMQSFARPFLPKALSALLWEKQQSRCSGKRLPALLLMGLRAHHHSLISNRSRHDNGTRRTSTPPGYTRTIPRKWTFSVTTEVDCTVKSAVTNRSAMLHVV